MRLKVSNVCQLLDKSKYPATKTENGITWTNNGDGTITTTGKATSSGAWLNIDNSIVVLIRSHKYLLCGCPSGGATTTYWLRFSPLIACDPRDIGSGIIFTAQETATCHPLLQINPGVGGTLLWKPQFFDLTEMYGAGNEPTTVEQFRQDFPNEMYEYSPVCWKKFRRLKYVTETKNLMTDEMFTSAGFTKQSDGSWYIPNTTTLNQKVLWENTEGIAGPVVISLYGKSPQPNATGIMQFLVTFTDGDIQYINGTGSSDVWAYSEPTVPNPTKTIAKIQWVNITGHPLYLRDVMFEWGSTATPYQPYGYLPLNRGKYIANKEPVQLLDKSKFYETSVNYGVTWTNNSDGTITANGTATNIATYTLLIPNPRVIPGHKYLFISSITPQQSNVGTIISNIGGESGSGFIFTTDLTRINIYFYTRTGVTVSNVVFKPQLYDLTAMYGEGNEPTTVAQFRADFPNELYDYNPYNAITFR